MTSGWWKYTCSGRFKCLSSDVGRSLALRLFSTTVSALPQCFSSHQYCLAYSNFSLKQNIWKSRPLFNPPNISAILDQLHFILSPHDTLHPFWSLSFLLSLLTPKLTYSIKRLFSSTKFKKAIYIFYSDRGSSSKFNATLGDRCRNLSTYFSAFISLFIMQLSHFRKW